MTQTSINTATRDAYGKLMTKLGICMLLRHPQITMAIDPPYNILNEVNKQLSQPPKKKSRLAPYFEAHYEYQDPYVEPSPSPEPSLEAASAAATAAWPTSRKRAFHAVANEHDTSSGYSLPRKRSRLTATTASAITELPLDRYGLFRSRMLPRDGKQAARISSKKATCKTAADTEMRGEVTA